MLLPCYMTLSILEPSSLYYVIIWSVTIIYNYSIVDVMLLSCVTITYDITLHSLLKFKIKKSVNQN